MNLERPIVFFDLETTGPSPSTDRIVQIACVRRSPDGSSKEWQTLVNPTVPIPPEATEVHGITDAMVSTAPTFGTLAGGLMRAIGDADLGGYNARRLDVPLLLAEFKRAGFAFSLAGRAIIDPMRVFYRREPRDLSAAVRFYCGREMTGAHEALADIRATLDVLDAQLERYPDLPKSVAELSSYCAEDAADLERKLVRKGDDIIVNFGEQKGKSLRWLAENDRGFLSWMLRSDFMPDTKALVEATLQAVVPRRTGS